ncbi:MAG TPA: ATP-binding protein [Ktedonobacteraceae bacterium]|nr:ATP-binding protein [Ktedonobacteraceae bacterium]
MQRSRFALWPLNRDRNLLAREPGAVLFRGLRVNLTLWYCGVMAAALILFSVALYFSTEQFLIGPIKADTAMHAQDHLSQLLQGSPNACPSFGPGQFGNRPDEEQGFIMPEMIACFDQHGNLQSDTTGFPGAFLANNLAKEALRTGQPVSDTIDAGGSYGQIYRYAVIAPNAVVIPNAAGSGSVRVIVAGEIIQPQENALSVLLKLLLAFGAVSLLGAGLGGLFLSNRALAPARLAWTNQQRFIGDAAHELRTPLTLLRADAEVLLRTHGQLDEEDSMLLEDIVAETNHMSNLATNLLTLARLDNSSAHREHEVIQLSEIARAGTRRIQALADQSEISIHTAFDEKAVVIGDPTQLEQAVLALLDNAIKYNRPGGQIIVRTAIKQGQALLEVQDTGIGIAAEHLPHVGERFYRVDKARSRQAGGTGLGLSIARGIATAHSGTLTLTSIPDQGTMVTILLLLAQGTRAEHDRANQTPKEGNLFREEVQG